MGDISAENSGDEGDAAAWPQPIPKAKPRKPLVGLCDATGTVYLQNDAQIAVVHSLISVLSSVQSNDCTDEQRTDIRNRIMLYFDRFTGIDWHPAVNSSLQFVQMFIGSTLPAIGPLDTETGYNDYITKKIVTGSYANGDKVTFKSIAYLDPTDFKTAAAYATRILRSKYHLYM
jgi:hypothetical protein